MKNVLTLMMWIMYLRPCVGSIDSDFQKKCKSTFPNISKAAALQFLSTGKRVTPQACCDEGKCESYEEKCYTEQYRSLIVSHYGYSCGPGLSVAITSWCVGHISYECKDPCLVLGIDQCLNGGTCKSQGSSWTCLCHGYTGPICQTDIDECVNNPCNAASSEKCVNLPGTYRCHCKAGYTGKDCDTDINECNSGPCQHSGTCSDHVNSFTCSCRPGYTGVACEIDIDECASSPCQNGATCNDLINGYKCICAPGFYGTLCDTNICRPLPADVVFVLDSSVSMTESQFNKQLEFVSNFTDEIRLGHRDFQISVITYSTFAHIEFYLNQYRDNVTLKGAIANIRYKPGVTNTHLALEKVKMIFEAGHGGDIPRYNNTMADRFVYLLTDGLSNDRRRTEQSAAELKHGLGITISVIGIGNQVSHEELYNVASKTTNTGEAVAQVYSVKNFNSLYTVLKGLVHFDCKECSRSKKSDVAVVMDTSYTMTDRQLVLSKKALTSIIEGVQLGDNETKISLTTVTSSIHVEFDFDDKRADILAHINSAVVSRQKSRADMVDVLNHVSTHVLTAGRSDAKSFIILVGNSNFSISDENKFQKVKTALENNGVQTIIIGTGSDVSIEHLESLVSDPFNVYIVTDDKWSDNLATIQSYFIYSECDIQ